MAQEFSVTGLETGFGSQQIRLVGGDQQIGDSGFGSQWAMEFNGNTYTNYGDRGAFDPYDVLDLTLIGAELGLYLPDDGGTVLEFRGDFEKIFQRFRIPTPQNDKPIGPFTVEFINTDDHSLIYYGQSGLPGYRTQIFTNSNQKQLFVCTPSMLKGIYNIKLKYKDVYTVDFGETVEVIHRLRNDKTLSMRSNLPKFMNSGYKSDGDIEAGLQYYPKTESNLAVLLHAISQLFNHMYSSDYTIVTQQYEKGETILNVESTLSFPFEGVAYLDDGQKINYSGKNATQLLNVTGEFNLIEPQTRVFLRNENIVEIENYYKVRNYGFHKPSNNIRQEDWLNSFNVIEFGERASQKVIFEYLYQLLKNLNLVRFANVEGNVIENPSEGTWNASHDQRLCKIEDKFYFIRNIAEISGENYLYLDQIGNTYWNASLDFDRAERRIEILPFMITEDYNGLFEVTFEKSVFEQAQGFIDLNFIDYDMYFEGSDFDNNTKNNLNMNLFVAGGVKEKLNFIQQSIDKFGTYYSQRAGGDDLILLPDYEFALN